MFLLSTIMATPVHGFASWLRCYVELETDEVVMNHYIQEPTTEEAKVPIQIKSTTNGIWSSTAPKDMIRQDVQWVIEVTAPEQGAAVFVGNGVMCEGTRAHSKHDDPVTLQIKDASVPIQLVAGYAAGHEAVVLTPPMHINNNNENENNNGSNHVDGTSTQEL
ncbi:MAG: hypothetical protein SGBAC_002515 [Bacillariaceae sp.]